MRRPRRALVVLALLVAGLAGSASALAENCPRTSVSDLEDEIMCAQCGVPLALATDAPQARRERAFIQGLVDGCRSKDEIKAALVAEFGDDVLAEPGDEGFDIAAWAVPAAAFLAAGGMIGFALARWRRTRSAPNDALAELDPPELDPEDAERLDAELAREEAPR